VKKPTKANENNATGTIQLQQHDIILNRNLRCPEPKFYGKRENKTNFGYISVHNNGTNDLIYIFLTIIFFFPSSPFLLPSTLYICATLHIASVPSETGVSSNESGDGDFGLFIILLNP